MDINIKQPFVKFGDVKVGDIFYFNNESEIPCLKLVYYFPNGDNYVGAVNLLNGKATNFTDNECVKYYHNNDLTIEV